MISSDLTVVTACLYDRDGLRDKMDQETKAANEALACLNALMAALKAAKEAIACKAK